MNLMKEKGFSMIELLVAVVISAIGLLGIAAMQTMSIKNVNNTQFRTLATIYAYDMAERMRSNKASAPQYVGADTSSGMPCSGCSGIATADVAAWKTSITQNSNVGGLPEGVGTVSLNGDVYSIAITWEEQQRDASGGLLESQSFTLSIRM